MLNLMRKHPVVAFFVGAFAMSWIVWLPRVASQFGWIGSVSPYWHFWGSLGPMLAALIVAWMIEGRGGLEHLFRDMMKWRVKLGWWAVAVLGPVVVMLLTILIVKLMGGVWPDWSLITKVAEYPKLGFLPLLLAEVVFYGYGEEVGWRGFALPRLQQRYNALWASVIMSVFWALWHIPLLITNESYRQMNPLMLLGWYLSMLTGSILTTWLYNSTKGSLLLLALFHGILDIAMINQALSIQMVNVMGMLTTLWGIAVLFIPGMKWFTRGIKPNKKIPPSKRSPEF